MNVFVKPSKVLIVVVASCLAWIGVLALATVKFLGAAVSTGWIIGVVLGLAMVVGVVVAFREIRRAIELPDDFAPTERASDVADRLAFSRGRCVADELLSDRSVTRNHGMTAGSFDPVRPRRVRARQDRPRSSTRG